MKSLMKAVALITIFSLVTRVAGFLFRIYLSWEIGAESLGLYQIAFSVFLVLLTLVSSGLPLTVSKLTAKYETTGEKNKQKSMVTASLIIGGLVSLVLCLILVLFNQYLNFLFTDSRCVFILISLLPAVVFSSVYSVLRGVLWGRNNYFSVCAVELFEQIVRIVICVFALSFLFQATEGALVASISLSIACMFSMLLVCIIYFKKGGRLGNPKNSYKEVLKSSVPITGIRVATSIIQPLVAIIIPLRMISAGFTNEQALVQFGTAIGMAFPLLFLPCTLIGSLAMTLIPDLSSAVACNNQKHINQRIQSSLLFSFFISCLCVPAFVSLGIPICQLLFNSTEAGIYLQDAAWLMIPLSLNNITTSILNSLGLEAKTFKYSLLGGIFMLASIWFLPAYIGINSMIVGLGGCTLITMILNLRMINKTTQKKVQLKKPVLLMCLMIIPTILLTSNIFDLFLFVMPNIISLGISGALSIVIYLLLCEIFNVVKIKSFFNLKSFRKSKNIV